VVSTTLSIGSNLGYLIKRVGAIHELPLLFLLRNYKL
jgi:hypothetical protein